MTEERRKSWLAKLGPGLITGAADDDPSGIGTYSQIGAQFGYGLAWSLLYSLPFMTVIQDVSAQIGSVTGRGIAANLRRHYPRPILLAAVMLLLLANVINLGADLSAMGAVMQMLLGGENMAYTIGFGLLCILLETFLSYQRYAAILKFTTLSLFAYVAVVFAVHVPWGEAIKAVLIPHVEWTTAFATGFVAILGTTISPYLFFWQAAQEIEEEKRTHTKPLHAAPGKAGPEMARIRQDTLIGMSFSNIVAIFIVFAAAATLNVHGVTTIETASQAAEALRPVAGGFAFLLFAFGIVGTGLLAVPVLAGSAAYAVSEALGRPASLDFQAEQGQAFLRHDRGDHAGRGAAPICGNQPGARALLERRNQRHPGRPFDGADDAHRHQSASDGAFDALAAWRGARLGRDGGHDDRVLAVLWLANLKTPRRSHLTYCWIA